MLARLEKAFTTQRRFLDDTSHELRTPLTVIRGHLELLELDTSPQERRETVALVTDEIDRFTRLVNDLFLIAQAEHPDFLQTDRLNLHDLTLEIHRKASVLAERFWQLQQVADGVVTADRQRLTQAVLQLADNAVKHTNPATSSASAPPATPEPSGCGWTTRAPGSQPRKDNESSGGSPADDTTAPDPTGPDSDCPSWPPSPKRTTDKYASCADPAPAAASRSPSRSPESAATSTTSEHRPSVVDYDI